jgi:hypothetical protein
MTDVAELRAHLELFALGVSTPGRKKDPDQQELIDALLPGNGLSIQSGCVDQGVSKDDRCGPDHRGSPAGSWGSHE